MSVTAHLSFAVFQLYSLAICVFSVATKCFAKSIKLVDIEIIVVQLLAALSLELFIGQPIAMFPAMMIFAGSGVAYVKLVFFGQDCGCFGNHGRLFIYLMPVYCILFLCTSFFAVWQHVDQYSTLAISRMDRDVSAGLAAILVVLIFIGAARASVTQIHRSKSRNLTIFGNEDVADEVFSKVRTIAKKEGSFVIFFGSMGCGECKQVIGDFCKFANAFREHLNFFVCVAGYPFNAPTSFDGAQVIREVDELRSIFKIETYPALVVVNVFSSDQVTLFRGVDGVRDGLGFSISVIDGVKRRSTSLS